MRMTKSKWGSGKKKKRTKTEAKKREAKQLNRTAAGREKTAGDLTTTAGTPQESNKAG